MASVAALALTPAAALATPFITSEAPMMIGQNGATVQALFTVGETIPGATSPYTPVGIMDGIGAYSLNDSTVRVLVNHELGASAGAGYSVSDGAGGEVSLTGARISYFDIDKASRNIVDAGLAMNRIYDRSGALVTDASQIDGGLNRFCSSALYESGHFGDGRGFNDRLYFTGEESSNGSIWVVDVNTGDLHAAPDLGRGGWENVTALDTGSSNKVALLMGDDTGSAPLYLYVGEKDANGDFLAQNGLKDGKLYVWASDAGDLDPSTFNGDEAIRNGQFVEVTVKDAGMAGQAGYDAAGYANDSTIRAEADAKGAFSFSRPEDLATDPENGSRAVFASTGRDSLFDGADKWGTVYDVEVDFANLADGEIGASVRVVYDGDADATNGLRSPDNLEWAGDGFVFLQEDRSYDWTLGGNDHEASILRLDMETGDLLRVAEIDRSILAPFGVTDSGAGDLGNWESSGILDVSSLFNLDPGTLFIFDVQAHGLRDGIIADLDLVQGGQLLFLDASSLRVSETSPLATLGFGLAGLGFVATRRRRQTAARK